MSKPSDQVPSDLPTIPRDLPTSSLPSARPGGNMYERAERRYLAELAAIQGNVATVASAQEAFADPEIASPMQSEPQPEDLPPPEVTEPPLAATLPPPPVVLPRPVAALRPAATQRASTRRRELRPVLALAAVLLIGAFAAAVTIRSALAPPPPAGAASPARATAPPAAPARPTATAAKATETPVPPARTANAQLVASPAAPASTRARTPTRTAPAASERLARAVQPDVRRATATSPLASDGALRVTSTPPGARVTVNGIGWGQTPLTIDHLPFGTKTVRLTRDGYVSQERAVGLDSGHASASLRVTLKKR